MIHSHCTRLKTIVLLLALSCVGCTSQNPLEQLMAGDNPKIQQVVKAGNPHEIQIAYTQITPKKGQAPQLTRWTYGLAEDRYFYPASTAKLPVALLALQKINALQAAGIPIDKTTPFRVYDPQSGAALQVADSSHPQGQLTIAHLIKKIFLVSDNDAYNLLFDFLGKDYINEQLEVKGVKNTQIHHKFLFGADNTNTWEYVFGTATDTVYHQQSMTAAYAKDNSNLKGVLKGRGYKDAGKLVEQPMDFSRKNRISLLDLEGLLLRVILPELFPKIQQFQLTEADYNFVRHWMSRTPQESTSPDYSSNEAYYDSYVKFLVYGDTPGKMDGSVRIYNKVGDAYGTLTDVAYITVPEEDITFFLTATIHVNSNGIFNDDVYDYDRLGFPFLGALGREVLAYERQRR